MAYQTRINPARRHGLPEGSHGQELADKAVALAAQGLWAEAAAVNRELLSRRPKDTRTLNRLGKCLTELGRYEEAASCYEQTLSLDRLNEIARKNLARLSLLAEGEIGPAPVPGAIAPQVFITDPGKSTLTTLVGPPDPEALAASSPGAELELRAEGSALVARDSRGRLLGTVEPRLAQRLLTLMGGGNRYAGILASSADNSVRVVLRETYRHPSQAGKVSFPGRGDSEAIRAYTKDRLLRDVGGEWDEEDAEAEEGEPSPAGEGTDYPEADIGEEEPRDPFGTTTSGQASDEDR